MSDTGLIVAWGITVFLLGLLIMLGDGRVRYNQDACVYHDWQGHPMKCAKCGKEPKVEV